jgi:DNA-binding transcriptional ArsR family regulator
VADLLDRIRSDVDARLRELRPLVHEHERLQAALRALEGAAGAASGRPVAGSTGAERGSVGTARSEPAGPRAPRGANRQAVLAAVRERPGASAAELAAVSGVERTALYGVLRRLLQDGLIDTRELPTGRTGYTTANPPAGASAKPTPPVNAVPENTVDQERGQTSAAASPAPSEPNTS